jgi:hypothetical protein
MDESEQQWPPQSLTEAATVRLACSAGDINVMGVEAGPRVPAPAAAGHPTEVGDPTVGAAEADGPTVGAVGGGGPQNGSGGGLRIPEGSSTWSGRRWWRSWVGACHSGIEARRGRPEGACE